ESEARARTRERINEVLKKYTDPPPGKKKLKKKTPEPQSESIVLQTLKKTLDLEKDTGAEDETALQNTYRPEQGSPRFTKNRRREKEATGDQKVINVDHSGADEDNDDSLRFTPQKDVSIRGADASTEPEEEEGRRRPSRKGRGGRGRGGGEGGARAAAAAAEEEEEKEEAVSWRADGEDELLHQYRRRITQEEEEGEGQGGARGQKKTFSSNAVPLNNEVGKKKKKKLKSAAAPTAAESDIGDHQEDVEQGVADTETNQSEARGKRKKKRKQVVVEESDAEVEAGAEEELPQQQALDDPSLVLGVFIHRTDRLQTDLRLSHPMVKVHVVDELTGHQRPVSSFYEQEGVDHVLPIMTQPFHFKQNKSTVPEWEEQIVFNERFGHFLRDHGDAPRVILFFEVLDFMTMEEAKARANADKQERGFRKVAWAFLKLVGTNGVLNVDSKLRLQLFCPPPRARPQPRAIEEERGTTSYSELQSQLTKRRSLAQPTESQAAVLRWSRAPGQVCRIPNKPVLAFRGVYEIPSGTVLAAFNGHLSLVYDLCWSGDDRSLLSASSDGTVRVLPHPSFVYSARYHPAAPHLVVTGGYDGPLRAWRLDVQDVNGELLRDGSKRSDLSGMPINMLEVHPNGRRLLIHAKDSVLRVMDLRILAVKKFSGATNYRERIYSTFTPSRTAWPTSGTLKLVTVNKALRLHRHMTLCGFLGDQVAVYSELCYPTALRGVAFHPHENMVAFCAFGQSQPIHIPSGTVLAAFNGHLSLVYDLCWSGDDHSLLSASSDGTVREWNVERLLPVAHRVLPHPSFVYSARYHPAAPHLVVTGGYDGPLRAWRLDVQDVNGELLRDLVYDLCWSGDDHSLLSASSDGTVREWNVERLLPVAHRVLPHPSFVYSARYHPAAPHLVVTGGYDGPLRAWRLDVQDVNGELLREFEDGKQRQPCDDWCIERRIEEKDLSGMPINMLEVHPNGRRLLIHAKDSVLRVMDLRILAVKKFSGATNYRERIYSTFTPCGNFLFSGSEDGMAYVWNAETGDQVAVYSELCYPTALRGVAFHPHENMVAFCAFGQSQPIHVYLYDRKVSQLEAQAIRGGSRSASMVTPEPTAAGLLDATTASTPMDRFAQTARLSLKMQRVKDKLDSVLDPHRSASTGYMCDQDRVSLAYTGRSLTLESASAAATGLGASLPPPSLLSPHSKLHVSGALAEHLIPQAALSSQHREGFSPVGQRLKGAASLQAVVSLYDYSADRSDELTVRRGDVIQVLYKDNHNWWFGRLAGGQQGYFPAAYVADESICCHQFLRGAAFPLRAGHGAGAGHYQERSEEEESEASRGPSGPVPGGHGDDVLPSRCFRLLGPASQDHHRRPLPERPTGRANGAFEPDT
ncbi:hypothetical protein CRUP_038030, partial [Coryphaenoides rupestris]